MIQFNLQFFLSFSFTILIVYYSPDLKLIIDDVLNFWYTYVSYRLNKVYNEADVDNDDDDDDDDDDSGGGDVGGGYGVGVGDDAGSGAAGAAAYDDDDNDRKLNLPRNFFFMSTGNSKNTSQKFLMTGW